MTPLESLPISTLRRIRCVFTDIDDTLTDFGQLTARTYQAIESLANTGISVVPITGRPAGWCDLIARLWPVAGIVGENGAFYFRYDRSAKKMERYYVDSDSDRQAKRESLAMLGREILDQVPGAAISADQLYRETDLAIDFAEDVAPLSDEKINKIVALFHNRGATAKVSSIHVNGWFGDYDKLSMTRQYTQHCLGMSLDEEKSNFIFVGDSPNDAPMFGFFPNSVGVANVKHFIDRLKTPPKYVTHHPGGDGFSEVAAALIAAHRHD